MDGTTKKCLQVNACKIRKGIIEGVYNAKSGHPGGSLSIADLLTYLYFEKMNVNSSDPEDPDRDRFVLSKGHCAPALYAVLALKGYFSDKELKRYIRCVGELTEEEVEKFLSLYKKSIEDLVQLFSADQRMKEYLGL